MRRADRIAGLALLGVVLLVLGDIVLAPGGRMPCGPRTDLAAHFFHWRRFGFTELRHGNLALWNPWLYGGMPYLAGFQSALLYPPNLVFALLPTAAAVNLGIVLHLWLGGVLTYLWLRGRELSPTAAFTAGALFIGCAPHFLHVYAGHLAPLCVMAWTPGLLRVTDGLVAAGRARSRNALARWILLGAGVVAMQVLGGHPQYAYYAAIAAGMWLLLQLATGDRSWAAPAGLAAAYAGGLLLSAAQWVPGVAVAADGVRSGGLDFSTASMFSLPPENLLTLIAPGFLGPLDAYVGRCYLWEVSLFVGVNGLLLAGVGLVFAPRRERNAAGATIALLVVLALGVHTPLFRLLYDFAPGFATFRGTSKFCLPLSLFLLLLAARGLDGVLGGRRIHAAVLAAAAATGALVLAAGVLLGARRAPAIGAWTGMVDAISASHESYARPDWYSRPENVAAAAVTAGGAFRNAGLVWLAGTVLLLASRRWRAAGVALAALAVGEIFVFARANRGTMTEADTRMPYVEALLRGKTGDFRIFDPLNANLALETHVPDIWGYDPGVQRRWAELVAFSQGTPPDDASSYLRYRGPSPLWTLLRCRYIVTVKNGRPSHLEASSWFPRCLPVHEWRLETRRDDVLRTLADSSFAPDRTVLLESAPETPPAPATGRDRVSVVPGDTDGWTAEVELGSPGILLVTDAWAPGWTATAEGPEGPRKLAVQPADWALRAVSLPAGRFTVRFEYRPAAFVAGAWISAVSLLALAGAAVVAWRAWGTAP